MKYQAYPEYKDSGVEWLDKIPNHWIKASLKMYCHVTDGSHHSPTIQSSGEPFVSVTDVGVNTINFEDCKRISQDDFMRLVHEGCKPKAGELLLTKDGTIGRAVVVKETYPEFVILSSLGLLSPSNELMNYYLFYYLISGINIDQMNSLIHGSALRRMTISKIDNLIITLPSLVEQAQITNFLDHETAKIDTLIEKQQQLIKLLKEKRQAVISHAVTKGLNPNAPMRDSGVEWLGEVPEHWEVVPLKHLANIKYGIGEPPKYMEEGVALVRATNIRSGRISNTNLVFVNPEDIPVNRIVWLEVGDIIVVRSGAGTGDSSIIPKEYEGSIAGFDMVVKPINCISAFLGHALLSNYVRDNQMDLEKARAAQPHLNAEELGDCFILLPPKQEQVEIDQYIARELSKFDLLMQQVDKASVLLQERRTALISAAVTGKIDVRNFK